jgi:hypothetical protein
MPERTTAHDTLERALPIALGETVTDYFFNADDDNWFVVSVPGTGRLTVNTEGTLDTLLEVYDKWEELLGRDDDSGFQGNAKITVNIFGASPVYLKASVYQGSIGRYRLTSKFLPPTKPDRFENDDAISGAREILISESQERNFTDASDVDWALLRIVRRDNYSIAATAGDNYLDSFVQLFDGDGNLLGEDDDGGGYWDALLTLALDPGTYYIRVNCIDKEPLEHNEYTLSVSAESQTGSPEG